MKKSLPLVISIALLLGLAIACSIAWQQREGILRMFDSDHCAVFDDENNELLRLNQEQSEMAAIIIAASYQEGLNEKAAAIALATAYQESGIRNLHYGDRDSLGLFQQRTDPSLGWGTAEQVTDPWYASRRFYQELKKFKGWQNGDITKYAQKVQRSAFPEAYRKHEQKALPLAKAGYGRGPRSVDCVRNDKTTANPKALVKVLQALPGVQTRTEGNRIFLKADSPRLLWAAISLAQLSTFSAGVSQIDTGAEQWTPKSRWSSQNTGSDPVIVLGDS